MSFSEKLCNWALGLTAIGWGGKGCLLAYQTAEINVISATIIAFNVCVGFLILKRHPVQHQGSPFSILMALPSLFLGAVTLQSSPEPVVWPWYAKAAFGLGGALALTAFVFLGRNFAILPSVRNIVSKGPYQFVRHPAYVGELLMIFACCLAKFQLITLSLFVIGFVFLAIRIVAEERVLSTNAFFNVYKQKVPFKLIPFLW